MRLEKLTQLLILGHSHIKVLKKSHEFLVDSEESHNRASLYSITEQVVELNSALSYALCKELGSPTTAYAVENEFPMSISLLDEDYTEDDDEDEGGDDEPSPT